MNIQISKPLPVFIFLVTVLSSTLGINACASGKTNSDRAPAQASGKAMPVQASNNAVRNFETAKDLAAEIHRDHAVTIYCPCTYTETKVKNSTERTVDLASCGYTPKVTKKRGRISDDDDEDGVPDRATQVEWEHVVPAENFGRSFSEWRDGAPDCVHSGKKNFGKPFKGRKCARKNPTFSMMESDLYNLWPSIGQLNGLRSNSSMAQIADSKFLTFGACKAKIAGDKFEPMDQDKGVVARVYMYMDAAYPGHGVVSDKNEKLFAAWDKMYPVNEWECRRAKRIEQRQGNRNLVLYERCTAAGLYK